MSDIPTMTGTCTPAAAAQFRAALARLEGQLPEADCAVHSRLEALRLEDPAAMSGCWNPGCAAALVGRVFKRSFHIQTAGMLTC